MKSADEQKRVCENMKYQYKWIAKTFKIFDTLSRLENFTN